MFKAAIVVTGDGAELQNLLDSVFFGEIPGFELAAVVVTEPDSYALKRCEALRVPSYVVDSSIFPNAATFTRALTAKLLDLDVTGALLVSVEPEPGESFYRVFSGRCVCLRLKRAGDTLPASVLLADADGSEARRFGRASAEIPPRSGRAVARRAIVAAGAGELLTNAVKSYMSDYHG